MDSTWNCNDLTALLVILRISQQDTGFSRKTLKKIQKIPERILSWHSHTQIYHITVAGLLYIYKWSKCPRTHTLIHAGSALLPMHFKAHALAHAGAPKDQLQIRVLQHSIVCVQMYQFDTIKLWFKHLFRRDHTHAYKAIHTHTYCSFSKWSSSTWTATLPEQSVSTSWSTHSDRWANSRWCVRARLC